MVTKNIKTTNANKSLGLEGIPQILLLVRVDQMSLPVAKVSTFPLEEQVNIVCSIRIEISTNIIQLIKTGSRDK